MNGRHVLREGHLPAKKDPNELDNSTAKVNHRQAEQGRRTAIRGLQDQISAFFLVKGQKKISVGDLLLFGKSINSRSEATIYLPILFSYHLSKDR